MSCDAGGHVDAGNGTSWILCSACCAAASSSTERTSMPAIAAAVGAKPGRQQRHFGNKGRAAPDKRLQMLANNCPPGRPRRWHMLR